MKKLNLLLCLCWVSLSSAALASEIYKWTDDDGNVHYGDRPTGAVAADERVETVAIASRRTDSARVSAGIEARQEREAARQETRMAAAKAEEEAAKQQADAETRAQKCQQYRARLEKFVTSRRLYRVDDAGERSYLDEVQMQEARAKVQQQVEDYCSP